MNRICSCKRSACSTIRAVSQSRRAKGQRASPPSASASSSTLAPAPISEAPRPLSEIDTQDYLSGTPHATLIGKIVAFVLPPPVRFLASWIAPLTCLVALNADAVIRLVSLLLLGVQAVLPASTPVLAVLSPSWLPLAATAILSILPGIYAFLVMPIADFVLGEEEERGERVPDSAWYKPLYSAVCYGFVALHVAVFLNAVAVVCAAPTSLPTLLLTSLNVAFVGGFAFAVAHELVHSSRKIDSVAAQVLLTLMCAKHWGLAHMAHHAQVATRRDPASARFHEAVYPFALRSMMGEWNDALRLELSRASRSMPAASQLQQLLASQVPRWIGWPLALATALWVVAGPAATAMYALSAAGSVFFLEVVNYIEHYGLHRRTMPNGKPERVSVGHSWNANHMLSNAVLLRLQRHTDHHMRSNVPYYELQSIAGAPKLPMCYTAMMIIALVPPLWFVVMNPRVHMHRLLQDVQFRSNQPDSSASPARA